MRVLIPIDGSNHSRAAFELILSRKWDAGDEFKLITIVTPLDVVAAGLSGARTGHREDEYLAASNVLSQFNDELARLVPGRVHQPEVLAGLAREKILEQIISFSAELVVMGSHGRTGLTLAVLGSVSQSVLDHAPCPVLIAKRNSFNSAGGFRNVVIGTDGSKYSELAIDFLNHQAWRADAQFHFVHATPRLGDSFGEEKNVQRAARMLESYQTHRAQALEELARGSQWVAPAIANKRVVFELIEGDAREALISYAREVHADLIVVGSHGRTGLRRLLLGSVSHAISIHAPCSVLVVRPPRVVTPAEEAQRLDNEADSPPFTMM